MTLYVDNITEDVYCEQVLFAAPGIPTIVETLTVSSLAAAKVFDNVDESLLAQSETFAPNTEGITESALITSGIFHSTVTTADSITEVVTTTTSAGFAVAQLDESFSASSGAFALMAATLVDSVQITTSVFIVGSTDTLDESVLVTSGFVTTVTDSLDESLTASGSAFQGQVSVVDSITDQFTVTSAPILPAVVISSSLDEVLLVSSGPFGISVQGVAQLTEQFWVSDLAWGSVGPTESTAWVANTDTFAMSRYTGIEGHSISQDVLVGPEGVMVEGTEAMDVTVVSGMLDFSSLTKEVRGYNATAQKRIPYARVAATGNAVSVVIHETDTGVESYNEYPFEVRLLGAARPTRAALGKGLRSRFWRTGLKGAEGSNFYSFELLVDHSQRRV